MIARLLVLFALASQMMPAESFTWWVQPCNDTRCTVADEQLVKWALAAWERASAGNLRLEPAPESRARIRIYWVSVREGLYGETRGVARDAVHGADVYVRPTLEGLGPEIGSKAEKDTLFRDTIVYLTALHELGHALGLPHTSGFDDIMYNFGYGGDILEYFARYRRKLSGRDSIGSVSGLSDEDTRRLRIICKKSEN